MATALKSPPRLQIADGLFVDQLDTPDACTRAAAELDLQVKRIQRQLQKPKPWSNYDWVHRAVTALAFRKAVHIAVLQRREDLLSAAKDEGERRLFASVAREFMKRHPDECRAFVQRLSGGRKG